MKEYKLMDTTATDSTTMHSWFFNDYTYLPESQMQQVCSQLVIAVVDIVITVIIVAVLIIIFKLIIRFLLKRYTFNHKWSEWHYYGTPPYRKRYCSNCRIEQKEYL